MPDSTQKRPDITALIPAAGRVPEGVLALSNILSPAMIPVGGRPVVYWTLNTLAGVGITTTKIAVVQRGSFIEDFLGTVGLGHDIEMLVPSKASGVLRTVLDLLERTTTKKALIVLGDTSFELGEHAALLDGDVPFVLTSAVSDSYRWCTVDVDARGDVTALFDKVADRPAPAQALIGVYFIPDVDEARALARELCAAAEAKGARTELAPFLDELRRRHGLIARTAPSWIDCGNPDQQAASHRALLQKREFNELSIDPVLGTITKKSRNKRKFIDEINYLRLLPPELAVLFPRVLSFSTSWEQPFLTMEYYGYPTLSEVFVYENVDVGVWEQVLRHLRAIVVDVLGRNKAVLPAAAVRAMYVDKTRERLREIDPISPLGRAIAAPQVRVNDAVLESFGRLWPRIEARVDEMVGGDAAGAFFGSVIHGDLCFSNILYDLRSRVVKLVDPRGSFGLVGVGGDLRYDVAKLYHSVAGGYDLIVNDLVQARVDAGGAGGGAMPSITHAVGTRGSHDEIARRFERLFFCDVPGGEGPYRKSEIVFLTGLLFASMLPLHADKPRRQVAMLARALELLGAAA